MTPYLQLEKLGIFTLDLFINTLIFFLIIITLQTMYFTVIFGGVCIVSIIAYFILQKSKKLITISTSDEAHKILKSTDYGRHKPNAWLINTLSIVNPFTINNASLLQTFKKKVITTLSLWNKPEKYEELTLAIADRVEHRILLLKSNDSKIYLSKLAKQVTLDSFLTSILNVNAKEELVTELPELIIHLWKNRNDKKAQNRLQELFSANKDNFSQSEFWQSIQAVLSNHSNIISKIVTNDFDEKVSNPLNIIVPGWETMWRVVFYSLLELLRRPELLKELRTQLESHSKCYRDCVLLQWVLKETLRLYPPTKNIYRTNEKTDQDVCISVLQIHRNKNVWGADALEFRPDRFKEELTSEQKNCYLPFSISCPARHNFAYSFAGVIVAEILKCCPTFTVAKEPCSLPADKLLDMARDSYNNLIINV
jgi:hypothetical protein